MPTTKPQLKLLAIDPLRHCIGSTPSFPLISFYCLPIVRLVFEADQRAKEMKKLHKHIRAYIEKINEAYKANANKNKKGLEYQHGDLVRLHLRKER